jgi:hypothetical protein
MVPCLTPLPHPHDVSIVYTDTLVPTDSAMLASTHFALMHVSVGLGVYNVLQEMQLYYMLFMLAFCKQCCQ